MQNGLDTTPIVTDQGGRLSIALLVRRVYIECARFDNCAIVKWVLGPEIRSPLTHAKLGKYATTLARVSVS